MTAEELKTALDELPPGPFTVHLSERTPLEALHTDYAMIAPGGHWLNVHDAERMHWVDVKSIIRISCKRPAEPANSNRQ